jgi:hypothetical protein
MNQLACFTCPTFASIFTNIFDSRCYRVKYVNDIINLILITRFQRSEQRFAAIHVLVPAILKKMKWNDHFEGREIMNIFSVTYCITVKEKMEERLRHFERNFQTCWTLPLIGQQDTSCPGNKKLHLDRYFRCSRHWWIEWSQWKQRTKPTSFLFAQWNSNEQITWFPFWATLCRQAIIIYCFIMRMIRDITFYCKILFYDSYQIESASKIISNLSSSNY